MSAQEWKPSPRAREVLGQLWDAFADGDTWVDMPNASTARYTGVSLVWNGLAEGDPAAPGKDGTYSMRYRLSEGTLQANGLTRLDDGWRTYAAQLTELAALDAADELTPTNGGATMKVTIFGPNLNGAAQRKGAMHVHAAGCDDCRFYGPGKKHGGEDDGMTLDVASVRDAVFAVYPPDEFDYAEADWQDMNDLHFAPCVKALPEIPAAEAKAARDAALTEQRATRPEDDDADVLEPVDEEGGGKVVGKKTRRAPAGFDPAAVFLLGMTFVNLFEPIGGSRLTYRCKGCRAEVAMNDRAQHHADHKRVAEQPAPRPTNPNPKTKERDAMATTDKTPKVSKTKIAREAAIAVLKSADKPMLMADIVAKAAASAKVKAAGIPDATIRAQVNFELAEKSPVIVRVDRGVYAHKDAKDKKPPVKPESTRAGRTSSRKGSAKKTTAKRSSAKTTTARKSTAKKSTAKRSTAKSSTAKPPVGGSSMNDLARPAKPDTKPVSTRPPRSSARSAPKA